MTHVNEWNSYDLIREFPEIVNDPIIEKLDKPLSQIRSFEFEKHLKNGILNNIARKYKRPKTSHDFEIASGSMLCVLTPIEKGRDKSSENT